MRRLDPAYRACFADGSTINVRSGREAMRDEIAQTCGSVDAAAFDSFVDWLRKLYLVEMPNFIDRNYDSPLGLLSSPRAVAQLVRLGAFGRLGAAVRRRFADPRLHRLFSFQAMYTGLSPDSALALSAVITYMDSIEGVWFPEGGIHGVPTIMAQVAEKACTTSATASRWKRSCARRRVGLLVSVRHLESGSWPMLWSALLIFRPRTPGCSVIFAHHRRAGAATTRLRQWSGMSAHAEYRCLRSPPQHSFRRGMERLIRCAGSRTADA
jgi:hypothetical protein